MKICVIERNGVLSCVTTNAHKTPGCIGHLPSNTPDIDRQFVIKTANGVGICSKKKSQWLKEQIKNGQV